jgi:hypothetical protein
MGGGGEEGRTVDATLRRLLRKMIGLALPEVCFEMTTKVYYMRNIPIRNEDAVYSLKCENMLQ